MNATDDEHITRDRLECQEPACPTIHKRRERPDPRERAEHRAAALRAVKLFARTAGVSLAKAREAYDSGAVEVSEDTRRAVPRLPATTFKRWSRKFKNQKLAGLVPPPGNRTGSGIMDASPELLDFVIAMLSHNHLLSAKLIWFAMQKTFAGGEKPLPSCGAFRRWLRRWKLAHREHFERLSNPDSHRGKYLVSFGHMHGEIVRPLQVVEIDGSPANIYCLDGRYYLTVAIDVFSRRIFAIVSKTATAAAALLCYRKVIVNAGVSDVVSHDRGTEYMAARFQSGLEHCGSVSDPKPPNRGDLKPHIERAFRTIADQVFPALPGFIGRNVGERAAIESRKSFAARLGKNRNARFEVKLTATELQEKLDVWISEIYSNTAHSGLGGKTPNQIWREAVAAGWIARRLPERELDVLLADAGAHRVSKKGIRIDRADFWDDALLQHLGSSVRVALSDDLGAIYVFARGGEFLCIAKNPERSGIPRREMAIAARAGQRTFLRAARKQDRARARKYPRELLEAVLSNREAGAAPLTPVELADVAMLKAASDAVGADRNARPVGPAVQTASSSDRRWKEYLRLEAKAPDELTDDEKISLRVYKSSAAFAARTKFGAVA
jgi:transposase InsO family protein